MDKQVTLTVKEQARLKMITEVDAGRVKAREAAEVLRLPHGTVMLALHVGVLPRMVIVSTTLPVFVAAITTVWLRRNRWTLHPPS